MTLGKGRRQHLGIIIDFREKNGLIEELYAPCAQGLNLAHRIVRNFADVIEECDDYCSLTRFLESLGQGRRAESSKRLGS